MFFEIAIFFMILFTLFHFWFDFRSLINTNSSMIEEFNGNTNSSIQLMQNKTNDQLNNLQDARPNIKQIVNKSKPHFLSAFKKAMPILGTIFKKNTKKVKEAQKHLKNAYNAAKPDLNKAAKPLSYIYATSKPELNEVLQTAGPDLIQGWDKTKGLVGKEMCDLGNQLQNVNVEVCKQPITFSGGNFNKNNNNTETSLNKNDKPPVYIKPNKCLDLAVKEFGDKVTSNRKNLVRGRWSHVPSGCSVQSGGDWAAHYNDKSNIKENDMYKLVTGKEKEREETTSTNTTTENENNNGEYTLANGYIIQEKTGKCPNGCNVPVYDNEDCIDITKNDKEYRKCPWSSEINKNLSCTGCGAVLMPKNDYGYAPTKHRVRNSLLNNNTELENAYVNVGFNFMNDYVKFKNIELPKINRKEYYKIGIMVYKYQKNQDGNLNKKNLQNVINTILNTNVLPDTLVQNNDVKHNVGIKISHEELNEQLKKELNRGTLNNANIIPAESLKQKSVIKDPLNEAEKLLKSKRESVKEKNSDNRLGGSYFSYSQNYQPVDPRVEPNPYNSIWKLR